MNIHKTLPIILCLFFITHGYAQEKSTKHVLALSNSNDQKLILIPESKKIHITLKNGVSTKGKYKFLTDSSITIHNDTFLISNILMVEFNPIGTRVLGVTFFTPGAAMMASGLTFITLGFINATNITGTLYIIIGASWTLLATIPVGISYLLWTHKKKFHINSDWEIMNSKE